MSLTRVSRAAAFGSRRRCRATHPPRARSASRTVDCGMRPRRSRLRQERRGPRRGAADVAAGGRYLDRHRCRARRSPLTEPVRNSLEIRWCGQRRRSPRGTARGRSARRRPMEKAAPGRASRRSSIRAYVRTTCTGTLRRRPTRPWETAAGPPARNRASRLPPVALARLVPRWTKCGRTSGGGARSSSTGTSCRRRARPADGPAVAIEPWSRLMPPTNATSSGRPPSISQLF